MRYRLAPIREVRHSHPLAKVHGASSWRVMCVFPDGKDYVIYQRQLPEGVIYEVVDFIDGQTIHTTGVSWESAADAMMQVIEAEHLERAR